MPFKRMEAIQIANLNIPLLGGFKKLDIVALWRSSTGTYIILHHKSEDLVVEAEDERYKDVERIRVWRVDDRGVPMATHVNLTCRRDGSCAFICEHIMEYIDEHTPDHVELTQYLNNMRAKATRVNVSTYITAISLAGFAQLKTKEGPDDRRTEQGAHEGAE